MYILHDDPRTVTDRLTDRIGQLVDLGLDIIIYRYDNQIYIILNAKFIYLCSCIHKRVFY